MNRIFGTLAFCCMMMAQQLTAGWQCSDTTSLPVVVQDGNQWNVRLISDGRNGAIFTWQDRRGNTDDKVYAQRISATGEPLWGANGIPLSSTSGFQYYPQLVSDGFGGAFVVWEDNRTGTNYDIYMQHISADGRLLWSTTANPVCTASGHQYNPRLVADGNGGAITVWQDKRSGGFDIFAQRLDSSGHALWPLNGQSICVAVGDQLEPQVASDGAGGASIAWTDYRTSPTNPDIFVQHIIANGNVAWQADGLPACLVDNMQWKAQIVSDGADGAIVSWQDRRSATVDQIFAQHFRGNGVTTWAYNGIALCSAPGVQYNQRMTGDNAGGAYVVWQDNRTGSDYDIFAQHVSSGGALLWSSTGRAVCSIPGPQYNPDLSLDNGAVLYTWQDKRNGADYDIYCQSSDAAGTMRWQANGVLALRSGADQINPQMVGDGAQGGICTWADFQGGTGATDVYAQRVGANGRIGGGLYRSFTQADYAMKGLTFYTRTKGLFVKPNAGNLRDTLFKRGLFPQGLSIGILRPDSMRKYASVLYRQSNFLRIALPQTGPARPFDSTGKLHMTGIYRNPSHARINNIIVGEAATLKLNIAASDLGQLPNGFGDLVFNDQSNPANLLNGRNLRNIARYVDSVMTYWKSYGKVPYALIGSTLAQINGSFSCPLDTVSTRPLVFTGPMPLFSQTLLIPSPAGSTFMAAAPAPIQVFQRSDEINPSQFSLLQNYPNPFNPTTNIDFVLANRSLVTLDVYNVLGQRVASLFDRVTLDEGYQSVEFDGSRLSSGTYFYHLTAIEGSSGKITASFTKKMNLVK